MSVSAGANRRRMNPIARNPGAFDINVRIDSRQLQKQKCNRTMVKKSRKCPDEPETLNVMPREILMANAQGGSRYRDRHMMHCFSSSNGLGANEEADEDVMDRLVYAGVSVTGYDLHLDKQREAQGFVSSLGGLNTIINTGSQNIYPGDTLRVGPPLDHQKPPEGVPPEKRMFSVCPARLQDQQFVKKTFCDGGDWSTRDKLKGNMQVYQHELFELVMHCIGESLLPDATARKAATIELFFDAEGAKKAGKIMQSILSVAHNRRRFEIGRALSFAPPGHDMDVVLM